MLCVVVVVLLCVVVVCCCCVSLLCVVCVWVCGGGTRGVEGRRERGDGWGVGEEGVRVPKDVCVGSEGGIRREGNVLTAAIVVIVIANVPVLLAKRTANRLHHVTGLRILAALSCKRCSLLEFLRCFLTESEGNSFNGGHGSWTRIDWRRASCHFALMAAPMEQGVINEAEVQVLAASSSEFRISFRWG